MPSIAKTIGLILVAVGAACQAAQPNRPGHAPTGRSDAPPIDGSGSLGQSAGLAARGGGGYVQMPYPPTSRQADTLRSPRVGPLAGFVGRERAEGKGTRRTPSPPVTGVIPAVYEASVASGTRPAAPGGPVSPSGDPPADVPLSARRHESPLPLAPPGRASHSPKERIGGLPSVVTVAGSLAVVLGVFFLVAWVLRRATPTGSMLLPGEVFEVLGRAPMASRQQVHLLRCGTKLLLVSVTPSGAETLTEITDPAEVDRLAGLCREAHPSSATAAFRHVLEQFAPRRSATGFPGESDRGDLRPTGSVPATSE